MFPLKDENPHFLTPWISLAVIAANILAWIFVQDLGREPEINYSVCTYGLVPGILLEPSASIQPCRGYENIGGILPLFFSMFLHGSWLHLLGNMWFLWVFGNNVEDSMGHFRFLVFYLLCGLAAATAQIIADPTSNVPMVGASGAIGGVMGAYIILYPHVRIHTLIALGIFFRVIPVSAWFVLGVWFLLQGLSGWFSLEVQSQSGTAFFAHLGGFAAGGILIFLFRNPALVARHPYYGWKKRRYF